MQLNEYKHQALTDLINLKKINIFESLGHDAIPYSDSGSDAKSESFFYAINLEIIENKISKAIIDQDDCTLGEIMMKLFMDYNSKIIDQKAQELQDEKKQEQDDLYGLLDVDINLQVTI